MINVLCILSCVLFLDSNQDTKHQMLANQEADIFKSEDLPIISNKVTNLMKPIVEGFKQTAICQRITTTEIRNSAYSNARCQLTIPINDTLSSALRHAISNNFEYMKTGIQNKQIQIADEWPEIKELLNKNGIRISMTESEQSSFEMSILKYVVL